MKMDFKCIKIGTGFHLNFELINCIYLSQRGDLNHYNFVSSLTFLH